MTAMALYLCTLVHVFIKDDYVSPGPFIIRAVGLLIIHLVILFF